MNDDTPRLPGLYELVAVESTDSARAYAERLAAQGAEEGTLVWVGKQSEGLGRRGNYWISGDNNLHCAVILRPDDPFSTCCELGLLGSVSACQAITVIGEPLAELQLGWPNDVLLNRGKVAGVHLSGALGDGDRVEWLVLSLNVNTAAHPAGLGFSAASLRGEGFEVFDRVALLEAFARELLAWLSRWAEDGLAPVRKAWLQRGNWTDRDHAVAYQDRHYRGRFAAMEADGALKLQTPEGIIRLELAGFYHPDFTPRR